MQKQGGNFLLQALLALTLVFSFMPFFANKLSSRDTEARLYSVSNQIETVHNIARIFLRDEFKNHYPTGTIEFSKNPSSCPVGYNCNFSVLENYGLPMGFNPQTIFNQDISLVATREVGADGEIVVTGYINLTRGDLDGKNLEWAQLLRMLGMYASGDVPNINESVAMHIIVPVEEPYSDVVLKHETDENIGFLTELKMGDDDGVEDGKKYDIDGINILYANKGIADRATIYNLSVVGSNTISTPKLECKTATFFSPGPLSSFDNRRPALQLSGTVLNTNTTVFNEVDCSAATVNISEDVYANNVNMAEGDNNLVVEPSDETSSVENGDIELPQGQVYVSDDDIKVNQFFGAYFPGVSPQLLAERDVGTNVRDVLYGNRIVLSNTHTMNALNKAVVSHRLPDADIDIRLSGGISLIPDILLDENDINRLPFFGPDIYSGNVSSGHCGGDAHIGLFNERGGFFAPDNFLSNSLVQNILCQYAFYHRLERRINHKLMVRALRECEIH